MEIYDTLKEDHAKLKQLLSELTSLSGKSDPHELVKQVHDALIPHARAEEAVFYNSLRELEEAKEKIKHSFQEHMEAEALLRSLQVKEKIAGDWKKTAKELRQAIEHHIEEEEGEIFTLARRLLSADEARMMDEAFTKYKAESKEEGMLMHGLELVANLMPPRFTDKFRDFQVSRKAG